MAGRAPLSAGEGVGAHAAGDEPEDQRDDGAGAVRQANVTGQVDGGDDGGGAAQAGERGQLAAAAPGVVGGRPRAAAPRA